MDDGFSDFEMSWKRSLFHGQQILPPVRHQGTRPTCVFHSFVTAAEMEARRMWAQAVPPRRTDMMFHVDSFIREYETRAGARIGQDQGWQRLSAAASLFVQHGVYASASHWPQARRVHLSGAHAHRGISFVEVMGLIKQGRPVMGGFAVCDRFPNLGRNEIYQLQDNKYSSKSAQEHHFVVFVGYGRRAGRCYLVFQNSYGPDFGEDGYGRVWFDEVADFTTISVWGETPPPPLVHQYASTPDPGASSSSYPRWSHPGASSSSYPGWSHPGAASSSYPGWSHPGASSSSSYPRWSHPGASSSARPPRFHPGASTSSHPRRPGFGAEASTSTSYPSGFGSVDKEDEGKSGFDLTD